MALKKATIVLEGGATRGIFTSGALDYLMEQDIYFSDVIGVSAGACNAVDYVSRQPGRTRDCMIPNTKDMKYINGVKDTIREKSLMNMDLIFDKYPKELLPFKEGSFKLALKTGCPIIPIAMTNTPKIYEAQAPLLKKTHVVLQYGKPILPNELDADTKKHIGVYTKCIIEQMLEENEQYLETP